MADHTHQIYRNKFLLATFMLLLAARSTDAQQPFVDPPIDSLIRQIPAMMRSNETQARQMIAALSNKALETGHQHGIIQSIFFKAWLNYRHGTAEATISSIDSALQHIEGIEQDTALIKFYILKGQCFVKKTDFDKALENFNQALQIAEKRNDWDNKISVMLSIGWAYMEDGKPKEAIGFFDKVLRLDPGGKFPNRSLVLCNIASCYNSLHNYPLAASYAMKGIQAARDKGNNSDLANGLNILARSYYQQGKTSAAITFLQEAAGVREKIADPSMLASDYLELADLYEKNRQPELGIPWAKKAEDISLQFGNKLKLTGAYQSLSRLYEAAGDHKNAVVYFNKLLLQKDSLATDRYNDAFAKMQVQFDVQQKVLENQQLRQENLENHLRNIRQQRLLFLLVGGLLLLVASWYFVNKLMKSRYKTKLALEQLQEQKKRTMAVLEAEEKERGRIAGELHDGVGQTLAAASLQLGKAEKISEPLEKVESLIHQAAMEVRGLSHQLTPEILRHFGLVKAMEMAVNKLNDVNDKTVFSFFTHIEASIDHELASVTIYRCFQEMCNNIIKHAVASEVAVHLNTDAEEIELMVEDNGTGFATDQIEYGLGLKNMESRISIYDGELIIDSTPGNGTTMIVKIPQENLRQQPIKNVEP